MSLVLGAQRSVAARHLIARRDMPPTKALFMSLFASQAALVSLTPILPQVAAGLGVSTAQAGQLRSISGLAAGATALIVSGFARRAGLRDLLVAGLAFLAVGAILTSIAPTFAFLAAAQLVVGASLAIVLSAGIAAAAAWSPEEDRARVLSWTLAGQPVAWVVGMPVTGALASGGWRLAVLVVPLVSAWAGLVLVRARPKDAPAGPGATIRQAWKRPRVAWWALGEFFAYSAWTGTLVFSGALFVESYGASPATTGLILALVAAAYVPGGILARRWTGRTARRALILLAASLGVGVALFGAARPGPLGSAALLAGLAFLAGARTFVGSWFGLDAAPSERVAVMSVRAAALQFGYLVGAAAGGFALAAGGYGALGCILAAFFGLATLPHMTRS